MNRELAKYIRGLEDELSKDIWLNAITKAARNGTVNLKYDEIIKEYGFTSKHELKKYFNPKEAEQKGVLKILVSADTFVSFNFYERTKQEVGPAQIKLIEQEKQIETTSTELTVVTNNKGNYLPNGKVVQAIISHYIVFFKQRQVHQAIIAGIELNNPVEPKNISGEDVRHIKEIAAYFFKNPKVNNDEAVINSFKAVFDNWFNLPNFLQKKFKLRYMSESIDEIIISIKNASHGKREKNKKESEFDDKIKRAGEKDYTKLASLRKGSN